MRARIAVPIAVAVVAFLAVSFELARFLSAANAERDDVYALLRAQARGDAPAVRAKLDGCDAACAREVDRVVARLRRPGTPKILSYESQTSYALSHKTGTSRVAWAIVARNGFPVIQCVTVRRGWSLIDGASISLRHLSAPIGNEASC